MSDEKPQAQVTLAGDFSNPISLAVEKISAAIGWAAAPRQIVRMAKAEAEAAKIRALAALEVSEIERRGLDRMIKDVGREQENLETIALEAIKQINEETKPENVSADWLAQFRDNARFASETEMRNLWSRVLSGEFNAPGTYSKRTVAFLGTMDARDAEAFATLRRFIWKIREPFPLIYRIIDPIYKENGVNFQMLQHLESIGVVALRENGIYAKADRPEVVAEYFSRYLLFKSVAPDSPVRLNVGLVGLTLLGKELTTICDAQPVEGFFEYVQQRHGGGGSRFILPPVEVLVKDG